MTHSSKYLVSGKPDVVPKDFISTPFFLKPPAYLYVVLGVPVFGDGGATSSGLAAMFCAVCSSFLGMFTILVAVRFRLLKKNHCSNPFRGTGNTERAAKLSPSR